MVPRIVGVVNWKSESMFPVHVVPCRSLLLHRIYCKFPQTKWNPNFLRGKQNDGKNGVSTFKSNIWDKVESEFFVLCRKNRIFCGKIKDQMRKKLRKKTLDQWNANINAPFSVVRNVHATSVTFPSERKMTVFVIVFKKHEWKMTIIQVQILVVRFAWHKLLQNILKL